MRSLAFTASSFVLALLGALACSESSIIGTAQQSGRGGTASHVGGRPGSAGGRASVAEDGGGGDDAVGSGEHTSTGGAAGHAKGGASSSAGGSAASGGHGAVAEAGRGAVVEAGRGAGGGAGQGVDDDGGQAGSLGEAGESGAGGDGAGEVGLLRVPGQSERKRVRSPTGRDVVLEEELVGFASAAFPLTRIRSLTRELQTEHSWPAPDGSYISDFCRHPSGELSVVLVSPDRVVRVVRLAENLSVLGATEVHDPAIVDDPHSAEAGVTDLLSNGFPLDPARIGAVGEQAFTVVVGSLNSVLGYRLSFADGAWSAPARTLIEPASGLTPFLPIGGSFDTFGAMAAWYRAPLDIDEDGNAYVVIWASVPRIHNHVTLFQDGLTALAENPNLPGTGDSDLLLTKVSPTGERLWTRVIGTQYEDEPYAIRAHGSSVAVVGRSRRFPGFDNTAWDALVSVTTSSGDTTETVALELDESSILLGVDARPGGGWVVGGSDGWAQNPDGLSILSFGTKLLLELPTLDDSPIRRSVAAGPRHNELHTVLADSAGLFFAGHEDGPIMHTGDADPSQIHATGVLGFVPN